MRKSPAEMTTKLVFDYVISKLKSGELKPVICAKSVCVDAHIVTPDEVGKNILYGVMGRLKKQSHLVKVWFC